MRDVFLAADVALVHSTCSENWFWIILMISFAVNWVEEVSE